MHSQLIARVLVYNLSFTRKMRLLFSANLQAVVVIRPECLHFLLIFIEILQYYLTSRKATLKLDA